MNVDASKEHQRLGGKVRCNGEEQRDRSPEIRAKNKAKFGCQRNWFSAQILKWNSQILI